LRGRNVGITDGKFKKYAVEIGSGAMINIPIFIKIDFGKKDKFSRVLN
jgi:hypothetical protein